MLYGRTHPAVVAGVLAVAAALAGWMAYLRPERLSFYVFAGAFLPATWGLLTLTRAGEGQPSVPRAQHDFSGALTVAGLLVALSFGLGVATTLGMLDEAVADRAVGVAMGGLLIVTGNALPKILTPLARLRCEPARVQSLQRFAGWTFVLAGIAYAVLFLALEAEAAALWSTIVTGACVVVVAARMGWLLARRGGPPPQSRRATPEPPRH